MSRKQIEQSLEQLRAELDALGDESGPARERLEKLVGEIDKELEGIEAETAAHESLIERLRHHVEEFEVEHPRVTSIVNDIMVTLSNMGI